MQHHRQYGPIVPEKGWVPAPRYLLRRDRVLGLLKSAAPGALLEIGCGAGTLLYELSQRGFRCEALETSSAALDIAQHINADNVKFHDSPRPEWEGKFDVLCAFEVLEHIEDDRKALSAWHSWLKPGGILLMSVPARMSRWSASDVWAGHFRRYEKTGLHELLEEVGFKVEQHESYGFPLANIVTPFRVWVHKRKLSAQNQANTDNRKSNTDLSGVAREAESKLFPLLKSPPGRIIMYLSCLLQEWSSGRDWGDGYLVLAKKT